MPGIQPGSAACKASTLPVVLFLRSLYFYFLNILALGNTVLRYNVAIDFCLKQVFERILILAKSSLANDDLNFENFLPYSLELSL